MKSSGWIATLALLGFAAGCGNAPRVIQGTVLQFDAAAKTLIVQDEREPRAQVTFSLAHADVGAEPKPGDLVRLAYRDEGGTLNAVRVMNLSRQEELKKGH